MGGVLEVVLVGAAVVSAIVLAVLVVVLVREVRRSGWRVFRARVRRNSRLWRLGAGRALRFLRVRRKGTERVEAFHIETAEQVFELLGGMKGAVMKLGQMVSLLGEWLPGPYAEALRGLQQHAPPMSYELAAGVISAELGAPPEVVFRTFSPEPVAAASIGQVHRARLRHGAGVPGGGRDVAVKIQYPGVDVAIRADLDNASLLTGMARLLAPGIDPESMITELRERLGDELDYRKEADNQDAFRRAYEGHPWVFIPRVLRRYSTERVLVTEWVEGRSFYDMLDRPRRRRDQIGEQLFRFFVGSVGVLRFFNADPHPGNYFFRDDGSICFVDFGMVKRFGEQVSRNLVAQILALRAGDTAALREAMLRHGWFKPDAPVSMERVHELALLTQRPLVEHEPFTFTPEYVREVIESTVSLQGPYADVIRHMTIPADHMMLNRIELGVSALLARLGATNDWASIFDEYMLGGPPSTPMGEQVAGWPRPLTATGEVPV